MTIQEILQSNDLSQKKALFQFSNDDSNEAVLLKFNLWARHFFAKYFKVEDAPFHEEIDLNNLKAYRGEIQSFVDVVYRDGAKTSRTKLFVGFVICNDVSHFRKYFKILAADGVNSKQIVTDIYNMLVHAQVKNIYPEVFEKTETKREETMGSFTTATGIKVIADTVGVEQRGAIQEEARPDFIWFEDFENRTTIRSMVKTKVIWDNMEEARTGLAQRGACIYTCNYFTEMGNVHVLVTTPMTGRIVIIVPIITDDGVITWPSKYTPADIEKMRIDDDDFEGERLCKPSASKDVLFEREVLDKMKPREPIKVSAEFKIFRQYDPSHRHASGHDVAGGVGLDSSTSVFMDFDTIPARVVATFRSNDIKPEAFGNEVRREGEYFGEPIAAIENNKFDAAILKAKQLGVDLYAAKNNEMKIGSNAQAELGWNTNALTKPKMFLAFAKAVSDGLVDLADKDLIQECKSYTRNDLIDNVRDPRLVPVTRHFDLLVAACICWQMKDYASVKKAGYVQPAYQPSEMEGGMLTLSHANLVATEAGGRVVRQSFQQAPIQAGEFEQ